MLESKTMFVVGAGASNEVNLPVGSTLRKIIYDKVDFRADDVGRRDPLHGDNKLFEWIRRHYGNSANNYFNACGRIRAGILTSASIDDFLDVHRDDREMMECGKVAIAHAILEAEKSSHLSYDAQNAYNTIDFSRLEKTWYMGFFRLLHEGLSKADRHDIFKNATVISFNYDRCIEHFLVHALAAHYLIDRQEARELVRQLPIYHPFGSVGDYLGSTREQVQFGLADIRELNQITKNIKTYTERITDDESLAQMRSAVTNAHVVVFLGNAFQRSNMRLITPKEPTVARKRIYLTRNGVSDADLEVVKQLLTRLSGNSQKYIPRPEVDYHYTDTCYKLFEEFRMSLRQ